MIDPPNRLIPKYYRQSDGTVPVRDYIDGLEPAIAIQILNFLQRIEMLCTLKMPDFPEPHSRQIEGELREFRIQAGGKKFRVCYHRSDRMVILLHIFRKATRKTPESDKRIAWKHWEDFCVRMDADPRMPPSAIATGKVAAKASEIPN